MQLKILRIVWIDIATYCVQIRTEHQPTMGEVQEGLEQIANGVFFFFFWYRVRIKIWIEMGLVYFLWVNLILYFFLRENFNLWHPLLMIAHYHQTKTPISFWCRWGLNPRSLIQPSETLPIELTGTH